jgi:thiol-disulfide isomerase/thioredoxin
MRALPLLLLVASCVPVSTVHADPVRDALAARPLHDLAGEAVAVEDLLAGPVVLNFWAEWCAPCRRELPVLDSWYDEVAAEGVRIVAISIDSRRERAERLARELDLSMPLYHDGPEGLARQIDLPGLPVTYVLDAEGEVFHISTGSDADALAALRAAIDAVAAASPTTNATMGGQR